MNDDIKEILRTLKAKSTIYEYCLKENISYNDESYEAHLLLDYITNLQQENEKNIEMLNDIIKEQDGKLTNLQQEKEDYKSRCEKAVEYINYYGTTPEENDDTTCRHILKSLLNTLNGRSDE